MARIKVNPNAEANSGFEQAQPGVYQLRIEGAPNFPAVQEFDSKSTPGNRGLKLRLVFVDPSGVTTRTGTQAKNLGSIIDQSVVIYPPEKQGKLRSLVEACGLIWDDFDTDDLVGKEVSAKVGAEEYKGDWKNVVERYLKP